jgi:hypothetical protein
MAKVQFAGLISGLDVYALIVGLVKAESRTVDVFKAQKVGYQAAVAGQRKKIALGGA